MSSQYVREEILTYLNANSAETFLDLSGEFEQIHDFLAHSGVNHNDNWVGIQFVGSEEEPISLNANGQVGCYREYGTIYVHVVAPTRIGVVAAILPRAEALRTILRGRRIGDIIIDRVSPANFGSGATIDFEAGFTSGSFLVDYRRDLNL